MSWFPKHTVVVPVDVSERSLEAVDVGLSLVDAPSHLHVIHVLQDITAHQPGMLFDILDEAQRRDQAKQSLAGRLSDPKHASVAIHVAVGDPGQTISEFAERIKAELIVLPSHGRTGLPRLLIGSVAERISRLARCPVLILQE